MGYNTFGPVLLLGAFAVLGGVLCAPQGFPTSGNGLWFTQPGKVWSRDYLPIGNGYLAAMIPGGTSQEVAQLNLESLWSGGPFADPNYNGGNKQPYERDAMAKELERIRQTIFQSSTGDIKNISILTTPGGQYGSYAGAGHLASTIGTSTSEPVSNYGRWLDLDQALARTSWTQSSINFQRTTFCSHPTKACVEHTSISSIATNNKLPLPLPSISLTYAITNTFEDGLPAPNITCHSANTLLVSGYAPGAGAAAMSYAILIRGYTSSKSPAAFRCSVVPVPYGAPFNATLVLNLGASSTSGSSQGDSDSDSDSDSDYEAWITWTGDTNYDMNAGTAAHNFSFRSSDSAVSKVLNSTRSITSSFGDYKVLLEEHLDDVKATLTGPFSLDLGQNADTSVPTDVLKAGYRIDGGEGTNNINAYVDWVMFNYGRFMLWASSRGVLPANLQGKWANGASAVWYSDYHANINLQMNYWCAEMTGLSSTTLPLFDYMEKTWAPRGRQTAEVLYNVTRGWVTHHEMNIFGHTGMKDYGTNAMWYNYPEANAWMMFHVWDHFDHTNDVDWWKRQGYPLIKGVASFHLDKLINDLRFNDGTLVVSPCNSPEQPPTTLGCANSQQVIWQVFNAVEKGAELAGETDTAFLKEIQDKKARMDKGIKIGSWGQLQEWKVEKDSPTDTHRHLSHLIGLFPGYAISGFDSALQGTGAANGLSRTQVMSAASVSLEHRGNGTGPDADAGWEKAWRAAAWAQFGDAKKFYHEISYAISENFGSNLFSLYDPENPSPIFQIDANLAFPGAVMNGLIQAPDVPTLSTPLIITILPALPTQWSTSGSVKGARIRGGMTVSFEWKSGKLVKLQVKVDTQPGSKSRPASIIYEGKTLDSFDTKVGLEKVYTSF